MNDLRIHLKYDPRWLASQPSPDDGPAALSRPTGLRCAIEVVEPGSLEGQPFTARRVIDARQSTQT
jgi:hypothetical protein